MNANGWQRILVATDDGLHVLDDDGGITGVEALAGRPVQALAPGADGWWAVVGGRELWRSSDTRNWTRIAALSRRKATCLADTSAGLLVGTTAAHLMRLDGDRLAPVSAFESVETREAWHTPWGAPADVRSISVGADGRLYVNVHVGGVLRSLDGGASWHPTLDLEHDVHQVSAPSSRPGLVLVAAYDGFGVSEDGGDTWRWENGGLHAHYCRAVALAEGTVYLSASAGHHGRRAALYRRRLEGAGAFVRCQAGLPEWFADNVDTGCLAARGRTVAIGTEDGNAFVSRDAGETWEQAAKDLASVRAVAFA
jgi:hypothetical protein